MLQDPVDRDPLDRVHDEHFLDEVARVLGEIRRGVEVSLRDLVEESLHIIVFKGQAPAEHHIKYDPARPDIDLRACVDASTDDFGRSVVWTSTAGCEEIPIAHLVREAEIGDLDIEVVVEENVLGLEVAVDDLEAVRVFDARDDLLEEAPCSLFGHAAVGDDVVEELATGVFKDEDDVGRGRDHFVAGAGLGS